MAVEEPHGMAAALEFEDFLHRLVASMPGVQVGNAAEGRISADVVATLDQEDLIIEAKTPTPQTSGRLRDAVVQLERYGQAYRDHAASSRPLRLILAVPGVISPRKSVLIPSGIELWDGQHLQSEARRLGVPAPAFLASPETERAPELRERIDELLKRLDEIAPGKDDWSRYEKFCEDTLNLLFSPPLNPAIAQSRNENGVNRRDYVMPNYATDGFWSFMRGNYRADYLVVEVKNFATQAGKYAILQLANYLQRHGAGLVGLLVTRIGLAQDARWTSREQWILHDKLIIDLDDEDVRQMLLTKQAGGDPTDLVRQRIEDFRLNI